MRYMFLIYSQEREGGPPPDEIDFLRQTHGALMQEAGAKGILAGVDRLFPTKTATTVRMNGAKAIVTDGPFAETKEQLAGYYILECKDLEEAIEWGKRIPTACKGGQGCIEIRPIAELNRAALTSRG